MAINKKHLEFVNNYFLLKMNQTDAYQATYPKASRESARRLGSQLLTNVEVRKEVELRALAIAGKVDGEVVKNTILNLPVSSRKSTPDKVYLIQAENGLVKIGITSDVLERFATLNTASPIELRLLFFIETSKAHRLERALHYFFEPKRVKGEWFKLNDEDIAWVRDNYGAKR